MTSLPPISSLTHSDDSTLTTVLDLLFEPSPPLHALSLPILRSATFPSYEALIAAVNAQLSALAASGSQDDIATLSEILCSHPRLGGKKVDSEQSRKEQAQLQGGEEEGRMLKELNEEYEKVFPGLRYVYVQYPFHSSSHVQSERKITPCGRDVWFSTKDQRYSLHTHKPVTSLAIESMRLTHQRSVFVNARPRPVIMENMRSRIARGDIKAERLEAIEVS